MKKVKSSEGTYPYEVKMQRSEYEAIKRLLQIEFLKLQKWVKENDERILMVFDGRDAAGKGGTIKRIMEHLNPRGACIVALDKPSEIEKGQWYFNVIYRTYRPQVKSYYLTVLGITVLVLIGSWSFVRHLNILSLCIRHPNLSAW